MDAFPLRNWNRGLINKFETNLLSDNGPLGDSNIPPRDIEKEAKENVISHYTKACKAEEPSSEDLFLHDFSPTDITEEKGESDSLEF